MASSTAKAILKHIIETVGCPESFDSDKNNTALALTYPESCNMYHSSSENTALVLDLVRMKFCQKRNNVVLARNDHGPHVQGVCMHRNVVYTLFFFSAKFRCINGEMCGASCQLYGWRMHVSTAADPLATRRGDAGKLLK